jgi:hypothetical protein
MLRIWIVAFQFYMHKTKVLFIDNLLSHLRLLLIEYVQCYKIKFYLTSLYDLDESFMIIWG